MSANGRLVVFASDATNLLGPPVGAPNGTFQIFLRDRCLDNGVPIPGCTPATTLVSAAPDGGLGTASPAIPRIAANGATTASSARRRTCSAGRRRERPERRVRAGSLARGLDARSRQPVEV